MGVNYRYHGMLSGRWYTTKKHFHWVSCNFNRLFASLSNFSSESISLHRVTKYHYYYYSDWERRKAKRKILKSILFSVYLNFSWFAITFVKDFFKICLKLLLLYFFTPWIRIKWSLCHTWIRMRITVYSVCGSETLVQWS